MYQKLFVTNCLALVLLAAGIQGCTPQGADTTLGELLNEMTIGDLVEGFQQFADELAADGSPAFARPPLTDEQLGEIESFQARFQAGLMDHAEFGQHTREAMGDRAPRRAFAGFGFFGGPLGTAHHGEIAGALELTEEQRTAAREIFDALHADIRVLRDAAHEEIRGLLTEEQQAMLDERKSDAMGTMSRASRGPGRPHRFAGRLAESLELTEEQQTAIADIRETLRASVRERHEQAREAFLALLTPKQLELLEGIELDSESQELETDEP